MATLRDIAQRAQVDVSIVSRILHKRDYGRASAATRERIEQAAKELGYEPNELARSLVRQRTDMVALMMPDLYEPAFVRYLETIDELLEQQGMQVLPLLSRWSVERERIMLKAVRQRRADGLISLFYEGQNLPVYRELKAMGVPIVFRSSDERVIRGFDHINVDIAEGAYQLTRHLWENGYRRIGLLGGFAASELAAGAPSSGVALGYARALRELNVPLVPGRAIPCKDDGTDTSDRLNDYFAESPEEIDAILVQSNSKLPGLYRTLAERGLRMGQDIGVATITDSSYCHLTGVPVTAWEQPIREICAALVSTLMRRFQNSNAPTYRASFRCELVVRESSQKARR